MRIAIVGQQAFGKAALEAFLERGDDVAGVFVAPEPPGARPDPLGETAQAKGLKCFQLKSLGSPEALSALKELNVELGVMAYVTQFAPQSFVTIPKHGMIQFHPSLLPSFPGLDPHGQALRAGVKISGATVHFVIAETDAGPILMQGAVSVSDHDSADTLSERILEVEHRIYPDALRLLASGQVRLEGDICKTAASAASGNFLISPAIG